MWHIISFFSTKNSLKNTFDFQLHMIVIFDPMDCPDKIQLAKLLLEKKQYLISNTSGAGEPKVYNNKVGFYYKPLAHQHLPSTLTAV